jgi:hypothetical protein
LFQTALSHGFEKGAFLDAGWWRNVVTGEIIFLKRLHEMTPGGMFFQMEENEGVELMFKFHLQGPVAARLEKGRLC